MCLWLPRLVRARHFLYDFLSSDGGAADNLIVYVGWDKMGGVEADKRRVVLRRKKLGGMNGIFSPFSCCARGQLYV